MNNIGVFKDHDYMDEKDFVINQLEDSLSIQNRHLEESRNEIIVLKQRVQEQASNGVHLVVQLQDELYKLNSLWFNRLYVFITTIRVRSPFYNEV